MTAPVTARWSHVGLNCADQDATEEFYTRWFGFRRARVIEDDDVRVVFLRSGDVYLELFRSANPRCSPRATTDPTTPASPATSPSRSTTWTRSGGRPRAN
ncbi:VOC family protein [Streptomyces nogalater]